MKERPILFSAPMVRALLDGSKTQTRRVVKGGAPSLPDGWSWQRLGVEGWYPVNGPHRGQGIGPCPHGVPGDRLWVREAFRLTDTFDADSPNRVAERCLDAGYSKPWAPLQFEADGSQRNWMNVGTLTYPTTSPQAGKLRPGIHMPRWVSRITLEVSGVRVERLQDINEHDAAAEGVAAWAPGALSPESQSADLSDQFRWLWGSINGDASWSTNPWVWVVEFRRVK